MTDRMPNARVIQLVDPDELKKKKEELKKEKEKTYSSTTGGWNSSRWWDKDGDDKLEDWMLD